MKIGPPVRPGRRIEKKGQDRTGQSQKSQRRYISPIWREAPTEPIFTKNCTLVGVPECKKQLLIKSPGLHHSVPKMLRMYCSMLVLLQQCMELLGSFVGVVLRVSTLSVIVFSV